MTADQDRYLTVQAEDYVERIHLKAHLHNVGLRVESQAALNAALVCLHQALTVVGERHLFRTIAHECVEDILEKSGAGAIP